MIDEERAWLGRRGLACVLAGLIGWLWPLWPAYQQGLQAGQQLRELEQQAMQVMNANWENEVPVASAQDMGRWSHAPLSGHRTLTGQSVAPVHPTGDIASLVKWHTWMHQHQLSGWLGRVVSATSTAMEPVHALAGQGAIWRLEGPASYAQGVAMLNALARDFPGVMLLHVQARHASDRGKLRWLLELRWSADGVPLTPPPPWPQVLGNAADPFSPDRLKPVPGVVPVPFADAHVVAHVLPQVSVRLLRLAGVVSGEPGKRALVTTAALPGMTVSDVSQGGSPAPAWHALREGQLVGEERARVLSIEPRRVVLEHPVSPVAKGKAEPTVLEWASAASTIHTLSGRGLP